MAKVLVTGGAGFIGSHLVERLDSAGHEVVVIDNLSSGCRMHLEKAPAARLIVADVLDINKLEAELRGTEIVFHLAALISGQDSLREPERYLETNVTGTLRVLDVAARVGARRIILASSSTVYGNPPSASGTASPDRHEAMVPQPLTVYALSKLTAEHLLNVFAPIRQVSHTSLRLFNVYGPRQKPDHPYANVTCKLAHAAATSREFDVVGDGEQTRDFVFVDDVVTAFMTVAESARKPVYNVGSGVACSINELVKLVERVGGVKLETRRLPPWPNDIRGIRADVRSFASDHGYSSKIGLEQGLARTIAYFRERRG